MLTAHVTIQGDALLFSGSASPPADVVAHGVLDLLRRELAPQPVPTWLEFLARNASTSIGGRLTRSGHGQHQPKGLLRRERWRPTDFAATAWPARRLRRLPADHGPLTVTDATLIGLALAAGIRPRRLGVKRRTRPYLALALGQLSEPVRVLIVQTERLCG